MCLHTDCCTVLLRTLTYLLCTRRTRAPQLSMIPVIFVSRQAEAVLAAAAQHLEWMTDELLHTYENSSQNPFHLKYGAVVLLL